MSNRPFRILLRPNSQLHPLRRRIIHSSQQRLSSWFPLPPFLQIPLPICQDSREYVIINFNSQSQFLVPLSKRFSKSQFPVPSPFLNISFEILIINYYSTQPKQLKSPEPISCEIYIFLNQINSEIYYYKK
jgi:hypothetical protein